MVVETRRLTAKGNEEEEDSQEFSVTPRPLYPWKGTYHIQ